MSQPRWDFDGLLSLFMGCLAKFSRKGNLLSGRGLFRTLRDPRVRWLFSDWCELLADELCEGFLMIGLDGFIETKQRGILIAGILESPDIEFVSRAWIFSLAHFFTFLPWTFRRGRFQYGDLHFPQTFGRSGLRGNHMCPQRRHFNVGNFMQL